METKTITSALDDSLFSDKIYKKLYTFLTYWLVLSPIIVIPFESIGIKFNIIAQTMLISMLFIFVKFFEIIFNIKKLNFKNKTIIDYLLIGLASWLIISIMVNQSFNSGIIYGLTYFCCFCLLLNIDKSQYKKIGIVFVCEMIFNTILGLIDLKNQIIPGFIDNEHGRFVMSMQFFNPNWSGFIVIIAEMLCLWFVCSSEKKWQKVLFFVGYVVMTIGLFVGGSYAPELFLFLCELSFIIYLWIKNKKCPWWLLSAFLTTIFISFAVWFVPAFREACRARANFFYETLAVIDNIFGTNLVKGVSTLFDKLFGWGVFEKVIGSDGWERNELTSLTFDAIFSREF